MVYILCFFNVVNPYQKKKKEKDKGFKINFLMWYNYFAIKLLILHIQMYSNCTHLNILIFKIRGFEFLYIPY